MGTRTVYFEVLPKVQLGVLERLSPMMEADGFYLGGGTAVALQLGHRRSVDFDWFTDREFDPLRYAGVLKKKGLSWITHQTAAGTLHGTLNSVRLSFLAYHYPLLEPLVDITDYGCRMASLSDLCCMKLGAVAQRGSKKDFIDIWALLEEGIELGEMLRWYKCRYDTDNIAHILMALCYFDDAEAEPMPKMLVEATWREIKDDLRRRVKGFAGN